MKIIKVPAGCSNILDPDRNEEILYYTENAIFVHMFGVFEAKPSLSTNSTLIVANGIVQGLEYAWLDPNEAGWSGMGTHGQYNEDY